MDELGDLTRAFNDMAERVERLVHGQQELLANVSHELRSPLARIRVALALLPRDGDTEGRSAGRRDRPRRAGPADRGRAHDRAARRHGPAAPPGRRSTCPHSSPSSGSGPRTTRSRPGRGWRWRPGRCRTSRPTAALLKRALWNLVENAAKYGAPPITLAARRDGEVVRLSVADWGEGIAPAERERVLAPFYRLDRARTPSAAGEAPHGFGLGLTLARRVAEAHGGGIVIEPAAVRDGRDEGCRVTLVLPAPAASPR